MTNKEKAQALWATVMDRTLGNQAHREALDALLALKKQAKTSLDKLGVPQVMWDREDKTNRDHAAMAADLEEAAQHNEVEHLEPTDPLAEPDPDPLEEDLPYPNGPVPAKLQTREAMLLSLKPAPTPKPAGDQRGLISAEVRCLLMDTDHAYSVIVEMVKAKFPDANTTTRSVASVAAELRKCGQPIAFRRPAKGV